MKVSQAAVRSTLVLLIAVSLWIAIGSNSIRDAYRRDFLSLYTGGLMARTGQFGALYDYGVQTAVEDRLIPGLPLHFPFVRPPFYAFMLAPLSLLPVQMAFPVWIGLQIGLLLVVWRWAWYRFGPDSLVYCGFFLPACMGIAVGQDCVVLLIEMLGAWTLMERRKDGWAGLVLSLTLFKFHLFLLLPLAIVLRKRWSLLGGYAAGGTLLAGVSALLVGEAGIREYLSLLTRKDLENLSSPDMMIGLKAVAVNLGIEALWFQALLIAGAVGLVVYAARKPGQEMRWFWTAVTASMLVSPHTFIYDVSSLLVAGLLAVFSSEGKAVRGTAMVMLIPLPYFMTVFRAPLAMIPSLVVIVFLISLSGVLSAASPLEISPVRSKEVLSA